MDCLVGMGLLAGYCPHQGILVDSQTIAFGFPLSDVWCPPPLGEGAPHPVVSLSIGTLLENFEALEDGAFTGVYGGFHSLDVRAAVEHAWVNESFLR